RAMNEAMLDGVVNDAETTRRYRQQIHQELQHLSQLIDDLFDIAQLDAGHLKLNRKPTTLSDLITTALTGLSARAYQKNITIKSDVPEGMPPINIAPDKIQRVLYNLLDNAIHHTPMGGIVSVSVTSAKNGVAVHIHNTGSVIIAEDLAHIFEPFYRGERSRSRNSDGYRGTGLGL
ncbi:MAG TPA: HAMP domain-containing sensor histidine kinase, partial [Aggregatilineales bacterium]|nr:HAMP domain-containing sensor histidine kinase [Aggregatilineales bacterium]